MLDRLNEVADESPESPEFAELTSREVEVLQLIGTGCTNREISKQLYIAEGTVKSHVTHIFNRLNLKNRAQIAIYANSVRQAC